MKSWVFLLIAILSEVSGTIFMKMSAGLTKVVPGIAMAVLYVVSFAALALSLKTIDVSVSYAVWSGLGTAIIAVAGYILFGEPLGGLKIASICLIILGVVVLNLTGGH
jgi:small multidrug resistance pump